MKAARVEQAALADAVELRQCGSREQAAAEGAPDPCHSMRRQSADRVIEHLVERENSEHDNHTCHRADDNAGPWLDVA